MDETTSCMRCGKELPRRRLKEIVHEEGRTRVRQMVCPNCLDQIMNESSRVRGVVGTEKAAAAHIDRGPGTGERQSMGQTEGSIHLLQRHPKNHVFGLVDRPEAVKSILQELEQRGIAEEDVQVVRRQEDAQATEPDESGSRPLEVVARAAEKLSEEHEFSELYESKVEAGEYLVGIPTSDLIDKEAAHDILHEHGAHSINYYGQWVVEELET